LTGDATFSGATKFILRTYYTGRKMATGKTVLITGANSGIGLASAKILAEQGWNVMLLCRNGKAGDALAAELQAAFPKIKSKNYTADLSDFNAVTAAAKQILQDNPVLDVLLNNAGYYPDKIEYVKEIEKTLYSSHLGHMLLTNILKPALERSPEARIINVSSLVHNGGKVDRFFKVVPGHSSMKAYSDAKLANILYTMGLAKRLPAHVTTYSLHPGVVHTGFARTTSGWMGTMVRLFGRFLMSPENGAATSVFLTTANIARLKGDSGKYYDKQKVVPTKNKDITPENAEWLWDKSVGHLQGWW
jgi:retinol dehydrogenase 12